MARVLATMSGPGGGTRPLAAILRWLSTPQEECGEEAERQKETVLCALSLYGEAGDEPALCLSRLKGRGQKAVAAFLRRYSARVESGAAARGMIDLNVSRNHTAHPADFLDRWSSL